MTATIPPGWIGEISWRRWGPGVFLIFLFLLGGGSRSDIDSLPLLRAGALLMGFAAALSLTASDWRRIRFPMTVAVLMTAWIAIQLIPLPPAIWQNLPGREIIAKMDEILGFADLWRPINLTPSQGWNALLGMVVPLAALPVAALIKVEDQNGFFYLVLGLAALGIVVALAQAAGGMDSAAYFYRITNRGAMTGLFSNRNHFALFLACATVIAAMVLRDNLVRRRRSGSTILILAATFVTVPLFNIFVGSRAGLVLAFFAVAVGYVIIANGWFQQMNTAPQKDGTPGSLKLSRSAQRWSILLVGPALFSVIAGAIMLYSTRQSAFTRFAGENITDDLRVSAWSTVTEMIEKFWLWGSGFGSFPSVYKMFETDALLTPRYFNHAHNDVAELVITGGLPAVALGLALTAWIARSALRNGLAGYVRGGRNDLRLGLTALLAMVVLASVFDYPLRTPSLQAFVAICVVLLCANPVSQSSRR